MTLKDRFTEQGGSRPIPCCNDLGDALVGKVILRGVNL